jgi:nucleotide-binding universal stress UspA family protein
MPIHARGGGSAPFGDTRESPAAITAHAPPRPSLAWPFGAVERPYARSLAGRPVVLAYDGSADAAGAARVARAAARELSATVQVVSVVDTTPVPIPFPLDLALSLADEARDGAGHQEQGVAMSEALSALLGERVDWTIHTELGVPAATIAGQAARTGAALIVMGLRRHGVADRVMHDETALSVMRTAMGPVLGVTSGMTGLPTSSLVAMDFSRESIHAAATAATLMAPGGSMTLAFVETMFESDPVSSDGVIHALGREAAFAAVVHAFSSPALRVDHVVLHHTSAGSPSSCLLAHAEGRGFDLLAAGSAPHGRLDRILLGSVSADLVRDGRYSVLIAPPPHG